MTNTILPRMRVDPTSIEFDGDVDAFMAAAGEQHGIAPGGEPITDGAIPWPACGTCGEVITGEGLTVICNGGAHHQSCAPHGEAGAS